MIAEQRIHGYLQPRSCINKRPQSSWIIREVAMSFWMGQDRRHPLSADPANQFGHVSRV